MGFRLRLRLRLRLRVGLTLTPTLTLTRYAVLVRGRNLKNTPKIAALLPYELCLAIVTDANLHRNHLDVSTQFVGIARP